MTSQQFIWWLDGYIEASGSDINSAELDLIKEKLKLALKSDTAIKQFAPFNYPVTAGTSISLNKDGGAG